MTPAAKCRNAYRQGNTTIRRLAERYGVSYGAVWGWLHPKRRGNHSPRVSELRTAAAILRRLADVLEGGK